MITIRSTHHAALVFRHLREGQQLARRDLARRLFVSPRTIQNRELGDRAMAAEVFIDTARALGFTVTLLPDQRPGWRETGTGWPA